MRFTQTQKMFAIGYVAGSLFGFMRLWSAVARTFGAARSATG